MAAHELGQRYSRLVVLAHAGRSRAGKLLWQCLCDCGSTCVAPTGALRSGNTKSCGCLSRERAAQRAYERSTTHGLSGHPLYHTWSHMISRCTDPSNADFGNYGGRGISVCERWLVGQGGMSGLECFIADVGDRPKGTSLDRVNNNGNYEPKNCRWASRSVQSRNKRTNIVVRVEGKKLCLKDACEAVGANYSTVQYRIRNGMSFNEAAVQQ